MQAIESLTSNWLVALSLLVSVTASYAGFNFAERIATAKRDRVLLWTCGGGLSFGLGLWSMHYLGMLAITSPVRFVYHLPTVFLSLLLAVVLSTAVLTMVSRNGIGLVRMGAGAVLMGLGSAAMHYLALLAMRPSGIIPAQGNLLVVPVLAEIALCWCAFWIVFSPGRRKFREESRLFGALVVGVGIAVMHYAAQAGLSFSPVKRVFLGGHTIGRVSIGLVAVALTTALVLMGALITALVDRRMYEELEASILSLNEAREELLRKEQALREANARLTELSVRDGLTGAYNRRYFDSVFTAEWRRSCRSGAALSLLMVDVDNFKLLNDRYGHLAGDDCLRGLAESLQSAIRRQGDLVARFGGEEFAVVLPGADLPGALLVAEQMRSSVQALQGPPGTPSELPFVTVSIGVCTQGYFHSGSPEEMINAADKALYCAKEAGRDCVQASYYGDPTPAQTRMTENRAQAHSNNRSQDCSQERSQDQPSAVILARTGSTLEWNPDR